MGTCYALNIEPHTRVWPLGQTSERPREISRISLTPLEVTAVCTREVSFCCGSTYITN